LGWGRDEYRRDRRKAPQDNNARECLPGPEPGQKQVAWNFEKEITRKKQGHAESKDGIAKSEAVLKMELCETDIGAINVIEDIAGEEKRDQASRDLGQGMPVAMICTCDRQKR